MKQTLKSALLSAVLLAASICTVTADDDINRKTYENPVIPSSTPDPTIIKCEEDGFYYLYGTEDTRNMPIYRSKNLVDWIFVGTAFNEASRPACAGPNSGAGLWAPDINYINGQYVLYFSIGVWGQTEKCGVGVATSDRPEGPFVDRGVLFRSQDIGVTFSIDQFYIEEDGHKYMFWGSFRGIWAIELADDGLSLKPGAGKRKIAGDQYEGTYIHKRDGYYYLIVSTGDFMKDYHVVVGRSRSLMGPYVDRAGRDMLGVHHELVVGNGNGFVAPGHNAEFVTDDKGQDWMLYHTRLEVGGPRYLILDRIEWNDGWPEVRGHVPARSAEAPVFE